MNRGRVLSIVSPTLAILVGCAEPTSVDSLSDPRLGEAVQAAGYPCIRVVKSDEFNDADTLWRVSCGGTDVYTAAIREELICIAPVHYADASISLGQNSPRAPMITPPESCVLVANI
jgi:hypothetical protein